MALASHQLEAFYHVAQTGSFTKAAERLHVTQSALSQRIFNLEEELGTTLFIRDRSGLRWTDVAHKLMLFYKTTHDLEADFLSSLQSKDQMSGVVRIAGFSSVLRSVLLPSLAPLLKRHPGIQFQSLSREFSELLPLLKSGEVDYIVTDRPYEREELESYHLGDESNVLVEAKNYDGPDIYIDNDEEDKTTLDYMRLTKRKAPFQRRYLDDVYGLIDGVKLGLGRALLPRHLIAKESGLKILNPGQSLSVRVYLHHFRQPFYSRLHNHVIEALTERAPALLK